MIEPSKFPICRNFSLILICALLGACATTQKSSTGSGAQSGATGSEAAQSQSAATPSTPDPGAAGTQAQSNAGAAKSAGAAGGAKPDSPESAAARRDEEAAQLKRQLAEQDAQIAKLRDEEKASAERLEAEAAMQREQQAAAAAAAQTGSTSTSASKADDELAVFPASAKAQDVAGSESVVLGTQERSVYFAYDQSTVAEKYDSMLMAHAAYLKAHPSLNVEVQGNCDERGSREYNLALGARRAQAVKRALELAGVDGSRISVISYGAEKPVAIGKDEQSYSQNRRADIVY